MTGPLEKLENLERKFALLLAQEQEATGPSAVRARHGMEALTALIRSSIDPEWTSDHLKPWRKPRRIDVATVRGAIIAVLADEPPLTVREIARLIAARLHETDLSDRELRNLDSVVRKSLRELPNADVEVAGSHPQRWALSTKS